MQEELLRYFRCAQPSSAFALAGALAEDPCFFRLGDAIVGYGPTVQNGQPSKSASRVCDLSGSIDCRDGKVTLPFDPDEVVHNLRGERYAEQAAPGGLRRALHNAYYAARPVLPVFVRKHLQKVHLNGWRNLDFPRWPVDITVDKLLTRLLALAIGGASSKEVPFVWFWPEGAAACAVMTHDVETESGIDNTRFILNLNAEHGIPASFQVVPEERYQVTPDYLDMLREHGQEINVQGLNHDGYLFRDKESFRKSAAKINEYARQYGALGFRSPVLYRNQEWFEFLEFEYDSSVPNVAHLDPQRGGCCTVMPYFVGGLIELPVTMTQDYSLFHILNEYSLNLWTQQSGIILEHHGLINCIVHPDYISGEREQNTYRELLELYSRLRRRHNVWVALPREVSSWWKQRDRMRVVKRDGQWRIEGQGSERARLAFASVEDGRIAYRLAEEQRRTAMPAQHSAAPVR